MSAALGSVLSDTDVHYYENFADCNSLSRFVYLFYQTCTQTHLKRHSCNICTRVYPIMLQTKQTEYLSIKGITIIRTIFWLSSKITLNLYKVGKKLISFFYDTRSLQKLSKIPYSSISRTFTDRQRNSERKNIVAEMLRLDFCKRLIFRRITLIEVYPWIENQERTWDSTDLRDCVMSEICAEFYTEFLWLKRRSSLRR